MKSNMQIAESHIVNTLLWAEFFPRFYDHWHILDFWMFSTYKMS